MRRPDSRLAFSTALRGQLQDRWAENPEELKQKRAGGVLALEVTQLAISSTDIRRQLAAGHSPRFLLPDGVLEFIRRRGLYQD
jgi:nicotinate-nucleotide adenylyltransferase